MLKTLTTFLINVVDSYLEKEVLLTLVCVTLLSVFAKPLYVKIRWFVEAPYHIILVSALVRRR